VKIYSKENLIPMINITASIDNENLQAATVQNNTGIENHKIASNHLAAAAAYYSAAGNYHKAGDHEKAHESIISAQGHLQLAGKAQKEEIKFHSLKSYPLI
jgi:hypothetical protein